ncbi:hypothetical protein Agub_g11349, partial [Astrephomene gubernaculifera]
MQHLDGEGQVRRGRRLLHALLTLPEGGEQLGFFAPEFGEALRAPRGVDLHAVAVRLDAGLYQSTGDWLAALSSDVRAALSLWRAALSSPRGKSIPGHQDAEASLADVAERKLQEILANPETTLALPAPPPPPTAAAANKAQGGDVEMQDADAAAGASGAAGGSGGGKGKGGGKGRKGRGGGGRGGRKGEEGSQAGAQSQPQSQGVAPEGDEEEEDAAALDDPTRLFNPRDGCRVCWLDEDKNRILLCDCCDGEYHCYCVEPPLLEVPEGSWFCPSCTSKGLGPPKAEGADDVTDALDSDTSPGRRTPADPQQHSPCGAVTRGSAGASPCSPAFQHGHSHSHLVSELHDKAAIRRAHQHEQRQRQQQQGQQHGQHAGCCGGDGRAGGGGGGGGAGAGEGPLVIPADIPEGPRITLRPHSRPGLQEVAGLLRLAHLLGNYDYCSGTSCWPPSSSSSSSPPAGWTPSRRLALLASLCDLAADTNALRGSLEEAVEARKKARVEAMAIRARARQIMEEQAAAKAAAAAEKENAPVKGSEGGAANPNVPAGKGPGGGGKGGKGGKKG